MEGWAVYRKQRKKLTPPKQCNSQGDHQLLITRKNQQGNAGHGDAQLKLMSQCWDGFTPSMLLRLLAISMFCIYNSPPIRAQIPAVQGGQFYAHQFRAPVERGAGIAGLIQSLLMGHCRNKEEVNLAREPAWAAFIHNRHKSVNNFAGLEVATPILGQSDGHAAPGENCPGGVSATARVGQPLRQDDILRVERQKASPDRIVRVA